MGAAILKKAQNMMKLQGEAVVKINEQAGRQPTRPNLDAGA
jgi:hypothetical protein